MKTVIMKHVLLLFTVLVSVPNFRAQSINKVELTANIDEVKLFLTAGQLTHKQDVKLKKGRNRLVFKGLSVYADPSSIQFNAGKKARVISVSTELDFSAAEIVNPRITDLKDSLDNINDQIQFNNDKIAAYYAEEGILNTNRDLGGESKNLTVEEIRAAADFYHKRTLEIKRGVSQLQKETRSLGIDAENVRYQLVELNYDENQRSNQVIVLVDVEEADTYDSQLKYLVTDCGWAASYDLSAEDINEKVNLNYKAQVYNNTGTSWNNVKLTLSTADPQLSATFPELKPWYLTYQSYTRYKKGRTEYFMPQSMDKDYRQLANSEINLANQRVYDNYYMRDEAESRNVWEDNSFKLQEKLNPQKESVALKQIQISELSTEFDIEESFTCPSDAQPYTVNVRDYYLDATFSHITIPKLDRSAFLLAHITGWQELDLMPGPTNVYFGGQYVGVSEIDTRNVSDTLSLSFGRDEKVTVLRKLKNEMTSKSVIGNTRKESYLYEIAVRNNRSTPISLEVYDQVPISQNSEINVIVDELTNGKHDEETGEVMWRLNVQPSETKSKQIGYTVKYPKNTMVSVKTFRTMSCPSF